MLTPSLSVSLGNATVGFFESFGRNISEDSFTSGDIESLVLSVTLKPSWISSYSFNGNLTNPYTHGSITVGSVCENIVVRENFAYLACQDSFVIVDVSDTSKPVETCTLAISGPNYACHDVDVKGDYAFLASEKYVDIVDISNKSNPEIIAQWTDENFISLKRLQVHKNEEVLYVLDNGAVSHGLRVLNISNKSNPIECHKVQTNYEYNYVAVSEELELLSHTDDDGTMYFYDISNPNEPVYIVDDQFSIYPNSMVFGVQREIIVTAAEKSGPVGYVLIRDASSFPTFPLTLATFQLGSFSPKKIVLNDDETIAFVAVEGDGIAIVNITNLENPKLVGFINESFSGIAHGLFYEDLILYSSTSDGLKILGFDSNLILNGTVPRSSCSSLENKVIIRATDSTGYMDIEFFVNIDPKNHHFESSNCDICESGTGWSGDKCDQCVGETENWKPSCMECLDHYFGEDCGVYECAGFFSNETTKICHGKGNCSTPGGSFCSCKNVHLRNETNCQQCHEFWHGEECDIYECAGFFSNETKCNERGNCSIPGDSFCSCYGYFSDATNCLGCLENWLGEDCDVFECAGFWSNGTGICSGHGSCSTPGGTSCVCGGNFDGDKCEECLVGYYGDQCEVLQDDVSEVTSVGVKLGVQNILMKIFLFAF